MTESAATGAGRMAPEIDDLTRPYWESAGRGQLSLQWCAHCRRFIHAPMIRCPQCHSGEQLEWRTVSGHGTIYSRIVVHGSRIAGFRCGAPHLVAMIELDEQPRLFLVANVTDCASAEATIGVRVHVHFDDTVGGVTLPQFRLMRSSAGGLAH